MMTLTDGARVGIIGGGPAGSLTGCFLLEMADRIDLELSVDIYEPRDFTQLGPVGCNMCGGIISESLVQMLATEGINLPSTVVQRGIDSYALHCDGATVAIRTPREEMRIAALHRGAGPRKATARTHESFDGHLMGLAEEKGARHVSARVTALEWDADRPVICAKERAAERYDLVVVATGVNAPDIGPVPALAATREGPATTKTFITEIYLGAENVQAHLGNSMHVFLLDMPRLEFAALIPKGQYVTACILGHDIDLDLVRRFMSSPEVRGCLPVEWDPKTAACRCMPRISFGRAKGLWSDRLVYVGDCGVTRLYKDGIGAAYRTAKACAVTAVCHGVSAEDFRRHYGPTCRRLHADNRIGRVIFHGVTVFRKLRFLRRAMLQMVRHEQSREGNRLMSMILWDTFTGSAPYRDVLLRGLQPRFVGRFLLRCLDWRKHDSKPAAGAV